MKVVFPVDRSYKKALNMIPILKKISPPGTEVYGVFVVDSTFTDDIRGRRLKTEVIQIGKLILYLIKLELSDKKIKFREVILEGDPFTEIVSFSRQMKADLIAMPTTGLCKSILQSTTEKVIRGSGLPVLTLYVQDS